MSSAIPKSIPNVNTIVDRQTRDVLAALKQDVETLYGLNGTTKGALLVSEALRVGIVGQKDGKLYSPSKASSSTAAASTGSTSEPYIRRMTYVWSDGSNGVVGTHNLGFSIPAGYRVTRTWFEVTDAFTSGGLATVSLGLDTDVDALLTATAVGGLTAGLYDGIQQGTIATFSATMATSSEVNLTVGVADLTAGKLTLVLEYMQIS